METRVTRRVRWMAAVLIVAALAVGMPATAFAKRGLPDDCVEMSCGDNNTGGPLALVAVGTRYGRTFKIGERIANRLCAAGYQVDLRFAGNVTGTELAEYDAVVVGGAIIAEEWHEDAIAFLTDFEDDLATKNVAYYCACMLIGLTNLGDVADMVQRYYLDPMYDAFPAIAPIDIEPFGGRINYRILRFWDWLILRLFFIPGGDWTDWEHVDAWADQLALDLQ